MVSKDKVKGRLRMSKTWQAVTQVIFLVLFIALVLVGRIQLWMGIFLASVVLALIFGRFFCGWICPINTVMRVITKFKRKLKIKSISVPTFLKSSVFRFGFLIIFFAVFSFVMVTGKKLPVLPALFILGVGLTLFFPESLWHRYLCPYGTILSFTGSRSKKSLHIDSENCIQCGSCFDICPGEAIREWEVHAIEKKECLLCLDCVTHCPSERIIVYG